MIERFNEIAAAVAISVPPERRLPIAVVGAGAIVDVAHLPAYQRAGLEVVGICDLDRAKAERVAQRHGIERTFTDVEEVLEDDRVQVVDVAVPASAQPEIARLVLASGRHMLGQKPFAGDSGAARELADLADESGLVLAVNQQLRYDEGMAVARQLLERGWLGEVTNLTIDVDIWTEWTSWPWMLSAGQLEIWNHSIHYHDLVRSLLGEPETVYCVGGRTPGQSPVGETRTLSTYRFARGVTALVSANHENAFGDPRATFRLQGSRGAVRGTLGLLYDYPNGRPDSLEVTSQVVSTDGWVPYPISTRWIPDAFVGPMAAVMTAAAGGLPPPTSVRDNVATLELVEALYRSMRTGEAVRLRS